MSLSTQSDTPDNHHSPLLYAHRGSMLLAPENTFAAFELALVYGADIMETDVRLSRDGEVIVIHDERIDRTCNGHGRVCDMTLSELKKLNAAHHFQALDGQSHHPQDTRLLSLAELFERLPNVPINIDIKDNSLAAAEAVAQTIDKAGRHALVNVASFHTTALAHFRKLQPATTTTATQAEVAKLFFGRSLYQQIPFECLQIPTRFMGIPLAGEHFIRHAKQRSIKMVYWTINDKPTMLQLIQRKVSGIVTDRVDIAAALLGKT